MDLSELNCNILNISVSDYYNYIIPKSIKELHIGKHIESISSLIKLEILHINEYRGQKLPNSLKELYIKNNFSGNFKGLSNLKKLKIECNYNNIENFLISCDSIKELEIIGSNIKKIHYLPINLVKLKIGSYYLKNILSIINKLNLLKELEINCPNLNNLNDLPNSITKLKIGKELSKLSKLPDSLEYLYCISSGIKSLPDLPNPLKYLYCQDNQISYLPNLPPSLEILTCSNNLLLNLPKLPNSLKKLSVNNNEIIELPNLPNSLEYLNCNGIEMLNYLPKLPQNIEFHFNGKINEYLEYNPNMKFNDKSNFKIDIPNIHIVNDERSYNKYMDIIYKDNKNNQSISLKDKNNNKIMSISNNILDENMCYNCTNMIDCYHCYDCNECKDCDLLILCNHCTNVSFLKNISNYDAKPYLDYCKENISDECIMKLYELSEDINENIFIIDKNILQLELIEFMEEDIEIYKKFLLGFKEIIYLLIHIYKFPKELFPNELI